MVQKRGTRSGSVLQHYQNCADSAPFDDRPALQTQKIRWIAKSQPWKCQGHQRNECPISEGCRGEEQRSWYNQRQYHERPIRPVQCCLRPKAHIVQMRVNSPRKIRAESSARGIPRSRDIWAFDRHARDSSSHPRIEVFVIQTRDRRWDQWKLWFHLNTLVILMGSMGMKRTNQTAIEAGTLPLSRSRRRSQMAWRKL